MTLHNTDKLAELKARLNYRLPNHHTPGINESPRNPDGPEAATALTTLQARLGQVTEALREVKAKAAWDKIHGDYIVDSGTIEMVVEALATEEKEL